MDTDEQDNKNRESCVEGLTRKEFLARIASRAAAAGGIMLGIKYAVFTPAPAHADATVAQTGG